MNWATVRAYQQLAFERRLERRNAAAREQRGLSPRPHLRVVPNDAPPQGPPPGAVEE